MLLRASIRSPSARCSPGYVGLLLLGTAFIACGIAASTRHREPGREPPCSPTACSCFSWFVTWNEAAIGERWRRVLLQLSLFDHFYGFAQGVIDSADVAYLLAFSRALPLPRAARPRRAGLAGHRVSRTRLRLLACRSLIVTAILACVVALAARHPWRLDLTPERRFTLSPYTREVLARPARADVRVTVFYSSQAGALRREMARSPRALPRRAAAHRRAPASTSTAAPAPRSASASQLQHGGHRGAASGAQQRRRW